MDDLLEPAELPKSKGIATGLLPRALSRDAGARGGLGASCALWVNGVCSVLSTEDGSNLGEQRGQLCRL